MNQPEFPKSFDLEGAGTTDFDFVREIDILDDSKNTIAIAVYSPRSSIIDSIRKNLQEFTILADRRIECECKSKANKKFAIWLFCVRGKAIEKCRDKLKTVFFEIHLSDSKGKEGLFSLNNYVQFLLPKPKLIGDMVERTFVHGEGRFYRFLLNQKRSPKNFGWLFEFLMGLSLDCPNHLFVEGPKASKGEWNFSVTTKRVPDSNLIVFAKDAQKEKLMKRRHENLERFLILNDFNTFACEVPVWLQPTDFDDFERRFATEQCITGHIDIIRIGTGDTIEVWDYKPGAQKEKKAAQQVWLYMLMLSKRANIPLKKIRGGYFDEDCAYIINQEIIE